MDGLKEIQVVLPEVRVGILFDPHNDVRTKPFSVGEFSGREALVTQSFRFTFKGEISMRNKVDTSYNLQRKRIMCILFTYMSMNLMRPSLAQNVGRRLTAPLKPKT